MRILIVTDAWMPQVNGVVRTLRCIGRELEALGHDVAFVTPEQFPTVPCPGYPEIRLSLAAGRLLPPLIDACQPCAIHISTEGPLGLAARRYCMKRGLPFTTAFHTRFAEYLQARCGLPPALIYPLQRRFHAPAKRTMVATASLRRELEKRGFRHLALWIRGVDTLLFQPRDKGFLDAPRPIYLYVGRVAVEKNIEAFLRLDLPGSKLVVGDGPALRALRDCHPAVRFVGAKHGEELARHYAASDVFVFPSRTDTFGLVLLEALASGLPVAAYPVSGPMDVLNGAAVGCLDDDLGRAARNATGISGAACRRFAERHSWRTSAEQFLANLEAIQ